MKLPLTYNANLFSIRRIYVSDLIETVLGLYVRQKSHNDRNLKVRRARTYTCCTQLFEKGVTSRDWNSKQSNLCAERYQLSEIMPFGVYPRFCHRRKKCIFPTRLEFMPFVPVGHLS